MSDDPEEDFRQAQSARREALGAEVNRETIAAAVRALREPLHACGHVIRDEPGPRALCLLHPAAGVLCIACAQEHVSVHEPSPACVTCGGLLGADAAGVDASVHVAMLQLTHPSMRAFAIAVGVTVHLVGAVQCAGCVTAKRVAPGRLPGV